MGGGGGSQQNAFDVNLRESFTDSKSEETSEKTILQGKCYFSPRRNRCLKLLALSPLMFFGSIHLHGNMYVQDIALIPYCHISLQLQDCILNQVYEIYRVCLQD